jgi:F-type H+-transporting ATPase subunit epsilon
MSLKVIVVTPERAVLDEQTEQVILPMFDGEFGVLTGHTAFVGQLGPGELRLGTGTTVQRYFIDGGFVQVARDVINILTPRAIPAGYLNADTIAAARQEAEAMPGTNSAELASRNRAMERAQGMAKVFAKKV